eukprot:8175970-Alexandrium_andersonii.AAC.2
MAHPHPGSRDVRSTLPPLPWARSPAPSRPRSVHRPHDSRLRSEPRPRIHHPSCHRARRILPLCRLRRGQALAQA